MAPVDKSRSTTKPISMNKMLDYFPLRNASSGSLADQAYEHILRDVVFPDAESQHQIPYGGKITESVIASRLAMSNGPVREALFRLRQEGWIHTVGNRGSFLIDFSDPEIAADIYRFRLSFETGAFYSLASSITKEQIKELENILASMEEASQKADVAAFRQEDINFHLAVIGFAGGDYFKQIYRPKLLQWYAMAYQVVMKSMGGEQYRHTLEAPGSSRHRELFEALSDRNSVAAAKLITSHFEYIANVLGIHDNY